MPAFADASGAMVTRLTMLRLVHSFLGKEDRTLFEQKLRPELPGILKWAVNGRERLRLNGRFTEGAAADNLRQDANDLVSPVGRFVREWCSVKPKSSVGTA